MPEKHIIMQFCEDVITGALIKRREEVADGK